jgi:hypothetical protein
VQPQFFFFIVYKGQEQRYPTGYRRPRLWGRQRRVETRLAGLLFGGFDVSRDEQDEGSQSASCDSMLRFATATARCLLLFYVYGVSVPCCTQEGPPLWAALTD